MLNDNEKRVIRELRIDSRQRFTQIARKTGIHKLEVSSIEENLRKNGVIRHVPILNFSNIGYNVNVILTMRTDDKNIELFLQKHRSVNTLQTIHGTYNLLAEAVFKNMLEMHDFYDELDRFDIDEIGRHHIIDELKRESFLDPVDGEKLDI